MSGMRNKDVRPTTFLVDDASKLTSVVVPWCFWFACKPLNSTKRRVLIIKIRRAMREICTVVLGLRLYARVSTIRHEGARKEPTLRAKVGDEGVIVSRIYDDRDVTRRRIRGELCQECHRPDHPEYPITLTTTSTHSTPRERHGS